MTVFVSYSRYDEDAVKRLVRDLESGRRDVWFDGDLRGGEAWWNEILRRIRTCSAFVIAVSESSLASKPCLAELDYATSLGVPVLPVQVGPVANIRASPVSPFQLVDYRAADAATGIALVQTVADAEQRRGPLPDPLPPAPAVPYAYLMRLAGEIDGTTLDHHRQVSIVAEIDHALSTETDRGVQEDLVSLLRRLRERGDVTFHAAREIDKILQRRQGGGDGPTVPGATTVGPGPGPGPARPADQHRPGQHGAPRPGQHGPRTHDAGPRPQARPQQPPFAQQPPPVRGFVPPPAPAPPANQALAIVAIVLGVAALLFPVLGIGGIVCAVVAKSRDQPLAPVAIGVSAGLTLLGFIVWISFYTA